MITGKNMRNNGFNERNVYQRLFYSKVYISVFKFWNKLLAGNFRKVSELLFEDSPRKLMCGENIPYCLIALSYFLRLKITWLWHDLIDGP